MSADLMQHLALGRTGLRVSRLGIGGSYPAPQHALEAAFERGLNYFYWGSLRRSPMRAAIRAIAERGRRDELVVALQSFAPSPAIPMHALLTRPAARAMRLSTYHGLRRLGLDHADVLILGWKNRPPAAPVMEEALRLREAGTVRFLAVSCHHRPTFQRYIRDGLFDIIMVRYNAAHRGAEEEVFPYLPAEGGPGVTCYTATRWASLLDPRHTPPGERTPSAGDCYRFCLTHPAVHLVMTGPSSEAHMQETLAALERGPLDDDELAWMRRVGDQLRGMRYMGVRVD